MHTTPPEPEQHFDLGGDDASLARMIEWSARFGDIFRVYSPARRAYIWVVNHPDDVKRVLVANHRNYTKGIGLDRVKILLGNGIMTSEGEFWRRQRYMMQPFFHRRVLTRFATTIAQANERLIERWTDAAQRGVAVNVTEAVSELTLDIVLRAIFSDDLERLQRDLGDNPFALVADESARDLRFAYRFRTLGKLVGELVRRRRSEAHERYDFLSMLMTARDKETGEAMNERELIDETLTLIVAGHETTASALNWTWYLLAQHPNSERRLWEEVDAAPEWRAASLSQLDALAWTRAVIDEALRLYPPGWLLSRRAIGADVLGGYHLPAGTDVLLSPYLLHRHPRYWDEPDQFRPQRFRAAPADQRPRFAYIPFAAGPR
ncbi:MAG: cytochrome P450, partial [Steroidobacteraceae bacterium]|nr:cytochrome P450 [Steroidobacteraceae bacterium]